MAIVFDSDAGTITGISTGGLPDGVVDAGTLASNAVTAAKLATDSVTAAKIAANSVDSAELVDGAVDDSHMASISGRRNILINGDFSVSQRGDYTSATTATHLQYYLDRFYVARDQVTGTIQDTGFAAKLVATSSATGTLRLVQPIEDTVWLGGKTVTLSCQMKSNDSNSRLGIYAGAWQSTTAAHTGGGAWETLSMTLTLPASIGAELSAHFGIDGASSANVSISSGAYCEMKDLQLEVGSTATDFEHRSYGEELSLCERYYSNSYSDGQIPGSSTSSINAVITTSWTDGNCPFPPFPTPMRVPPTITLRPRGSNTTGSINNASNTRTASAQDIGTKSASYISVSSGTGGQYSTFMYECDAEM